MITTTKEGEAKQRLHLPIDPRLRQRLVDVRRAEGRKRLRVLLVVAAAAMCVALAIGVLESPLARVRHVRLTGSGPLPVRQVLEAAGLPPGRLMVDVQPGADSRRLEALPLVATAEVHRQWPATVRIAITLRVAVAVLSGAEGRVAVDRTGRVLAAGPSVGAGLPALTDAVVSGTPGTWLPGSPGPDKAALVGAVSSGAVFDGGGPAGAAGVTSNGGAINSRGVLNAELALAAALPSGLARLVVSEAVTPNDGLVATVGTTTVVFGDTSQLASKVIGLEALLAHGSLTGTARADLRVPDRPALVPISDTRS